MSKDYMIPMESGGKTFAKKKVTLQFLFYCYGSRLTYGGTSTIT